MVTRLLHVNGPDYLSALVDGELDPVELSSACDAWRADETARATWHSYQLIGDVLRSDDLATDAGHDCAFLIAVRTRLAREPVVLAPDHAMAAVLAAVPQTAVAGVDQPASAIAGARSMRSARAGWLMPSAMAAGFALVVGAFAVMRGSTSVPDGAAATLAAADRAGQPRTTATFDLPTAVASANGPVLRDARLDRYLEAHKQFAGSSVLGVPSAFLRSATVDSSGR